MPIFDQDLTNKLSEGNSELQNVDLSSPGDLTQAASFVNPTVNNNFPTSLDQLSKIRIASSQGWDQPSTAFSKAELEENKKYPIYRRGVDLENIYGLQQSAWSQWGNSMVKFGANTAGIFVQGFAAIPNVIDAIRKKDFSQLSGDPDGFEGSIDNWLENLEKTFPNYYTKSEREHPWRAVVPFATGSANFWGDKFLKNLGFTAGAIGSALVQDALITGLTGGSGTAPVMASQAAKFSLYLNKIASVFKPAQVVSGLGRTAQVGGKTLKGIEALETLSSLAKIKNGAHFATTMLGASITEAGVEAREGYRVIKEDLIKEYQNQFGGEPVGVELDEIEKLATDAMNVRFTINTAILTLSNSMLFGNLARNIRKGGPITGGVFNSPTSGSLGNIGKFGLAEKSLDQFERKAVTSFAEKAWLQTKGVLPTMFSEGVYEEGGQFATEKGTYDYFTRKYKNLNNPRNRESWDSVKETIDSFKYGLGQQFNTDEGLQNMFIGALTGMFVTGVQGIVDKKRGTDKETRTQKAINSLNMHKLSGIFNKQYEDAAEMSAISLDLQEAVESGDVFKYNNLNHDMLFKYVYARARMGASDITLSQLAMLKDLDKAEFEKTFGIELNEKNKNTVESYVNNLMNITKETMDVIEKIDEIYKNPFTFSENPENVEDVANNHNWHAFDSWKHEIAYMNSKLGHLNNAKQEAYENISDITSNLSGEIITRLTNDKGLIEVANELEEDAKILESSIEMTTSARERAKVRKQVTQLRTLSGQASISANNKGISEDKRKEYFKNLVSFENTGRDLDNDVDILSNEDVITLYEQGVHINRADAARKSMRTGLEILTSEVGFKKYLESEIDVVNQVVPKEKGQINYVNEEGKTEAIEIGSMYERGDFKPYTYKKLENGTFEVPKPDGTKVITKTEPQAKKELEDTNYTLKNMTALTIVGIMPNGSVKVEDSEGNIYDIDASRLVGYSRKVSIDEFIKENIEDINNEEQKSNKNSSSIITHFIKEEFVEEGGRRKHSEWLFTSTTTESETDGDVITSPHIIRSRVFLNNAKTFENRDSLRIMLVTGKQVNNLGLNGILEQSYKGIVPENVNDVDKGWMAGVFISEEPQKDGSIKRYFIDQNGKKTTEVGEAADLNSIIYQTTPTTSLEYASGKHKNKYREDQKEEAESKQKEYKIFREQYFKKEDSPLIMKFDISRGLANISDLNDRNSIIHLVPENIISTHKGLINIPTDGVVQFQLQSLSVPLGVPILQYQDVLEYLQNRKFNKEEAETIFELLKVITDRIHTDLKAYKKPTIQSEEWDFIQQVMFTKSKGNDIESNQFRLNIASKSIMFSGKNNFTFGTFDENREEIISAIQGMYQNVNNQTLQKRFDEVFKEYYLNKDGKLSTRKWTNYQTYLLSPKTADGKGVRNDIPLTTNIAVPTAAVPYTHIAKYAKYNEYMDMFVSHKKQILPKDKPSIIINVNGTQYDINGTTENKFIVAPNTGDSITFTAKSTEGGRFDITIISDEPTIKTFSLIKEKTGMEKMYETFKELTGEYPSQELKEDSDIIITKVYQATINQILSGGIKQEKKEEKETVVTTDKIIVDGKTINIYEVPVGDKIHNVNYIVEKIGDEHFINFISDEQTNDTILVLASNTDNVKKARDLMVNNDPPLIDSSASSEEVMKKYLSIMIGNKVTSQESVSQEKEEEGSSEDLGAPPSERPNREDFRLIGDMSVDRMTPEDISIFKQWHEENIGTAIPYQELENIITVNPTTQAWGVFEEGVAKFYTASERGTEYHEIFEAIWAGFLTEKERQEILEEFRNSRGEEFVDRASGNTYFKSDPTISDAMIKERIADDFADFRLKKLKANKVGKTLLEKLYERIMRFFNRWLKSRKSLKESLFNSIDEGRFKNKSINPQVYALSPQYSIRAKIGDLSEKEINEYVEDMTMIASTRIFKIDSDLSTLFNYDPISKNKLFENIKYYSDWDKKKIGGELGWAQLVERTVEKLRTIGISFDEDSESSINEESSNGKEYIKDPFVVDAKSSAPIALKFLLSTLPKTVGEHSSNWNSAPELMKSENLGLSQLLPYTKIFGILIDRLANTNNIDEFVDKLSALAAERPDFVRLFTRLGGKFTKEGIGVKPYLDYNNFTEYHWRLFAQFYQAFSKQFPDAMVQFRTRNENYTQNINNLKSARDVVNSWIDNLKILAEDPNNVVFFDRIEKVYKVKPLKPEIKVNSNNTVTVKDTYGRVHTFPTRKEATQYLKKNGFSTSTIAKSITFLKAVGISFTENDYKRLSKEDKESFKKSVSGLITFLGSNNNLYTLSNQTLSVRSSYVTLGDLFIKANSLAKESTHFGVDGKRRGNYALDNAPSMLENDFLETKNVDELKEIRPELNDVYSQNSIILSKGGTFANEKGVWKKRIKISYVQGTKDELAKENSKTTSLVLSDRYVQEINQNLNGNYYIIMPADASTEWMVNMGNNVTYLNILSSSKKKIVGKIFEGYLKDEINLALDYKNREYLKNLKNRAKKLRMFADLLTPKMVKDIEAMVKRDAPLSEFNKYIDENRTAIYDVIYDEFIIKEANKIKNKLIDSHKIVLENLEKQEYSFTELDTTFTNEVNINKDSLSEKELNALMEFVTVNTAISNIEMHKILFGDPFLFANKNGISEAIKRLKSFFSPAKKMFDYMHLNNFLNKNANLVKGNISLTENDYGYHNYKDHARTTVLTDHKVAGSLKEVLAVYGNTDVTDGFSWIMDSTFKEVMIKNGQWGDEAEAFHQWQMAYTRQNVPGYKYTNKDLEIHDKELVKTPAPEYYLKILKPIVRGAKGKKNHIDLVIDKFAQMPVYYSMAKGTNLEKTYLKMFKEKIDYALVESSRKIGREISHDIYNKGGSFNTDEYNNVSEIPWKIYSIQVETAHDENKKQTRGSQITKIVSMNLFEYGSPVGETLERQEHIQDIYDKQVEILDEMHRHALASLLRRLGIEDTGTGYVMKDGKKVSDALVYEMLRRDVNENVKNTVKLDENNQFRIPFEASPSYIQIKDIMYSMINKAMLSQKLSGGAHVQVPVAQLEKIGNIGLTIKTDDGWVTLSKKSYEKLSEEDKEKVVFTNDTLKFYEDEDGKRYCEILIPHWFKNKFKGKFKSDEEILAHLQKNLPEVLSGIGFRIPTQANSSIEIFKVVGFLPQYMGATVVVPAEITTKTGSDFDIDKLNMYLRSIYFDEKGTVKLARVIENDPYSDLPTINEKETKEFFANLFDKKLEKKKENLLKTIKVIKTKYTVQSEKIQMLLTGEQEEIERILEDLWDDVDMKSKRLYEALETLNEDKIQEYLKENYVDSMYQKALENEYYISLEEMLTLPENFEALISPIDDGGYKTTAEELVKLRGKELPKNILISKSFLTEKRNAFALAKQWIGIAAVNITGLSNRQKSKVIFDTAKIANLSDYYTKWVGEGKIQLPHNTVMVDGKNYLSISGIKTKQEQKNKSLNYISNRLSGFATATVDVATDDYILDVYPSGLLISTAMFLEAAGAGELGRMFLSQPIILRYVEKLDYNNDKRLHNEKNIEDIREEFPVSGNFEPTNDTIDITKFSENISIYAKTEDFTDASMLKNNEEQIRILNEFLKYAVLGKNMFSFNQAMNFDTTKIRNGEEYLRKEIMLQLARENNLFSSIDDVMENTFVGVQKELMEEAIKMLDTVFKLDQPKFKAITNEVISKYAKREFISNDDFSGVIQEVKLAYLDYLIHTNRDIVNDIESLILSDNNISTRINNLKEKYPTIQILQELVPDISVRRGGAQTIKLLNNESDSYNENYYIGLMRELRDFNEETKALYDDLITIVILQGSKKSASSLKHIIPIEDYSEKVRHIIETANPIKQLDLFAQGMFERNNFSDNTVVPVFTPMFEDASTFNERIDERNSYRSNKKGKMLSRIEQPFFVNKDTMLDEYKYLAKGDIFPTIMELKTASNWRRLMVLSSKYNREAVREDFLKVPRVVQVKHPISGAIEFYDILKNRVITYQQYKLQKEKGDNTLFEYLGYQKVKTPNGEFLTTRDWEGNSNFVYKQVELLGEGRFLKEYYDHFRPSMVDNGTAKIKNGELLNSDIINYYAGITTVEVGPKEEFSYVPMKKDNVIKMKNGTKDLTIRTDKEYVEDGTYTIAINTMASFKNLGKARVVDMHGKPMIQFVDSGKTMQVDEFAKRDGFDSWKDFADNSEFSFKFINNGAYRWVYDVKIVNLSPEEQLKYEESLKKKQTEKQPTLFDINEVRPNFDKLPERTEKTFTYAGIGSRRTPADILESMKKIATYLATKGYTLNSGGAQGADTAFESGAGSKKEIFKEEEATDFTRGVAKEIHENPQALKDGPILDLLARNTYQIFGKKLDTPVDFVITWTPLTKEGKVVTKAEDRVYYGKQDPSNTGGTGQAIAMASMKGIPVINLADVNWKKQLDALLKQEEKETFDKKEDLPEGLSIIKNSNDGLYDVVDYGVEGIMGDGVIAEYIKTYEEAYKIAKNFVREEVKEEVEEVEEKETILYENIKQYIIKTLVGNRYEESLSALTDAMFKYITYNKIPIEFIKANKDNAAGGGSMILPNKKTNGWIIEVDKNSKNKALEILHELVHITTTYTQNLESPSHYEINEQINIYHSAFVAKLIKDEKYQKARREIQAFKNKDITREELKRRVSPVMLELSHAAEDAGEFMSSFVSSEAVQNYLNFIFLDQKSLFEELIEYIQDFIEKLFKGYSYIDSNNVIDDITAFITESQINYITPNEIVKRMSDFYGMDEKEDGNETPEDSNLFKTKVDQFNYSYNPQTGEVIHNAKAGDKVEDNETQMGKVLANYAKENKLETKEFNKQTYAKVGDRVVNINNGNLVNQKQILDLFESKKVDKEEVKKETTSKKSTFSYRGKSIETEFPLSPDQTKALEELIDFMNDSSKPRHVLQGAAGTGKTSIIGYLQKYTGREILYMAPTHAATVELAFGTMKTGNRTFPTTVASSLAFNKRTNKWGLSKKAKEKIGFGNTIVVDETSMLGLEDYQKLKNLEGYKVIFIGDKKQIPEVNKNESITHKVISLAFTENPISNLDQIHRTSNKDIKSVLQKVRDSITFQLYKIKNNTENLKFFSSDVEFKQTLKKFVLADPENTDYIGYTNASVQSMNKLIRESIFNRKGEVQENDILMGYLGYSSKQIESGNLANSVSYKVKNVEKVNETLYSGYRITMESERLKELNEKGFNVPLFSRTFYVPLGQNESLENNLTEEEYEKNNKRLSLYFANLSRALDIAKQTNRWNEVERSQAEIGLVFSKIDLGGDYFYNKDTKQIEVFDRYSKEDNEKLWKMYGSQSSKFKIEKGIDYGHAITIHKSQGRSTKNVFFDAGTITKRDKNIMERGNQISTERQSLGYVGLSRASENLFVNEGWVPFLEVDNTSGEVKPQESPKVPLMNKSRVIKVGTNNITLNVDGSMNFENGVPVTDEILINKVLIARENVDGTLRISNYNNLSFFVLTNNTILGAMPNNYGKKISIKDPKISQLIIEKSILYKKECK